MPASIEHLEKCFVVITGAAETITKKLALEIGRVAGDFSVFVFVTTTEFKLQRTKEALRELNQTFSVRCCVQDLGKPDLEVFERIVAEQIEPFDHAVLVYNDHSFGVLAKSTTLTDPEAWTKHLDWNVVSASMFTTAFLARARLLTRKVYTLNMILHPPKCKNMGMYCAGAAARELLFKALAAENDDVSVLTCSRMIGGCLSEENIVEKLLNVFLSGSYESGDSLYYN